MKEQGKVIKVKEKFVTVRVNRTSACGDCHACGMKPEDSHIDVEAEAYEGASVGDIAEVEIPEGSVVKMSLLAYAVPLLLGLLPFALVWWYSQVEWFALIALFLGVGFGFLLVKLLDLSVFKKKPRVTVTKIQTVEEQVELYSEEQDDTEE